MFDIFGSSLIAFLERRRLGRRASRFGLQSPEEIRRILHRERVRSDRGAGPFSLVIFRPRDDGANARILRRLAVILKRRLRFTDEIGWYDDRSLAAVLLCTPERGAWKVVEDVCHLLPANVPVTQCTVYCYPGDEGTEQPPSEFPSERKSRRKPQQRETVAKQHSQILSREREVFVAESVRSMDLLLARPTPGWKRAVDIVGSFTGLVLLSPVFAVLAAAVKLTSPGPVFFRQVRAGIGGRPFTICKFRSMVTNADAMQAPLRAFNEQDGPAFKMHNDPRLTLVGRFLRKTSLDELPQLWNVFCGDMSLVGPRPLPCHESDQCEGWRRQRLEVVPGVTCVWQVSGRSEVAFEDWMRMDACYVRRRSFVWDLWLLTRTFPAVLWGRGSM